MNQFRPSFMYGFNNFYFVALFLQPNPSITMGGMHRCGILFYAGSTTDICFWLHPHPYYFLARPFPYKLAFYLSCEL
jgi:hypothetical protein